MLEDLFEGRVKLLDEKAKAQQRALEQQQRENDRDRNSASKILPPSMK